MWLYDAAKSAGSTVSERASSLAKTVQSEGEKVLHSLESYAAQSASSPIQEPVYEEIAAFEEFQRHFVLADQTEEIGEIIKTQPEIAELHEQLVPVQLSYDEFWTRFFFRQREPTNLQQNLSPMENLKTTMTLLEQETNSNKRESGGEDVDENYSDLQQQLQEQQQRNQQMSSQLEDMQMNFSKQISELEAKIVVATENGFAQGFEAASLTKDKQQQPDLVEGEVAEGVGKDASSCECARALSQAVEELKAKVPLTKISASCAISPIVECLESLWVEVGREQAAIVQEKEKETQLWKARALKIKKLKEESEEKYRQEKEHLEKLLNEEKNQKEKIKREAYLEGIEEGKRQGASSSETAKNNEVDQHSKVVDEKKADEGKKDDDWGEWDEEE